MLDTFFLVSLRFRGESFQLCCVFFFALLRATKNEKSLVRFQFMCQREGRKWIKKYEKNTQQRTISTVVKKENQ